MIGYNILSNIICFSQNILRKYVYTKKTDIQIRKLISEIETSNDIVHVLQIVGSDNCGCDEIFDKLINIFTKYPPTEREMRIWSLIYQEVSEQNNIYSYSSLTLWLTALQSIEENGIPEPNIENNENEMLPLINTTYFNSYKMKNIYNY